MRTITESYQVIIENLKRIDYQLLKFLRPPTNLSTIKAIEKELEIHFNDELIELYSCADGTNNDRHTPCGLIGLIPIHIFMRLDDAVDYYKMHIDFKESFHNWERNIKPNVRLYPFLEDGAGNCYWVDLNEGTMDYGKIFWTNTFGEDPDYIFNSLPNMFHVISECYTSNIFFIDSEGYLECDYDQFNKLSKVYNKDLYYWKNK